ncbi:MAG: M81 family metallopeptidase, partial [Mesorhizobium sp.]
MRIFTASLATETNTYSPVPTDRTSFEMAFYAGPGKHPETPTLCSSPIVALRRRAAGEGLTVIEGTATWAEPGGLVQRQAFEALRDEILGQLREALPVDAVILGLHGAMVAQGYDDCEGDLLERVRAIVGPKVVIASEFDPHSHLTPKRVAASDIMAYFLEFPHTDFYERGEHVVELGLAAARGEIKPVISTFDCRMIQVLPTSREPMRSFVDKINALHGKDGVLSVSVIHGFMAADVPEMGTRILVVTDNEKEKGDALAESLGRELYAMRERTAMTMLNTADGIERALAVRKANPDKPVVIADIWDEPIDARVKVLKAVGEGWQSFGPSRVTLGSAAVVRVEGTEVDVILNTNRTQTFEPDIFSNIGVDPLSKDILLIKSTNHFYAGFAPIAAEIIYVSAPSSYP